MGHFLNFGPGPNLLPEPWQNLDASHDIRKRLRFDPDTVTAILAEHVIEHVPFLQALGFLRECLRVLEPGGVLRLGFPDISRFVHTQVDGVSVRFVLREFAADAYTAGLEARSAFGMQEPGITEGRRGLWQMLTGWGHQMAWTEQSAAGALLVVGFSRVTWRDHGTGDLPRIDGHHLDVGPELTKIETTILEAKK
jgi:ubiquinone/menaquinone biosynthesis C-methylase UbiE